MFKSSFLNSNLIKRLPLIITNKNTSRFVERRLVFEIERDENGVPVRNDRGEFTVIEGVEVDVVVFKYQLPLEFSMSPNRPKQITIDNIIVFDENGNEIVGNSIHSSFQHDIDYLDQCIGFSCRDFKSKLWNVNYNDEREIQIWFRDMAWNYTEPFLFVITGGLHY